MKLSDFKYKINDKLVAQYPMKERDKAKLMILDRESQKVTEGIFKDMIGYLQKGDVLVVNETKVFS
ncbi:S-adenosylmethionine:tRNA ribosyltransferase-isomerase, partial [bacterium]|nr:S-adenosylmethionine:tRNA ribosyltransferase-isomerase [bacterium]